ncbi:MAG: hypothetical protein SF052_24570 [Bacteroidia bacterium]|nr:hypothetical protein [Bacteroidia bacterium]
MDLSKKVAIQNSLIIILSTILVFGIGCNYQEKVLCSNKIPISKEVMNIDYNNQYFTVEASFWNDVAKDGFGIMTGKTDIKNLQNITDFLKINPENGQNLPINEIVIYYSNQETLKPKTLNLGDWDGISIYYLKNRQLFHEFYQKDDENLFKKIQSLSGYTRGLYFNHSNDLLTEIIRSENKYKGYIRIDREDFITPDKKYSFEQLSSLISRQIQEVGMYKQNEPPIVCSSPCTERAEDANCEYNPEFGAHECTFVAGCLDRHAHEIGSASIEVQNSNYALHYEFRDEFLVNSTFGLTYLGYYDILSEDIYNSLTPSLAIEILELFELCNPSIGIVLGPNANQSNEILITNEISTKAKLILNQYRTLTSNTQLLSIFDIVEADIDEYTGKPASYVLNHCCSN